VGPDELIGMSGEPAKELEHPAMSVLRTTMSARFTDNKELRIFRTSQLGQAAQPFDRAAEANVVATFRPG
jgi:hypothetical protein